MSDIDKILDENPFNISRGLIPGITHYRKFGRIAAIQADTPADVWEFGVNVGAELYTFSTTADIDTISGDNVGDTVEMLIEGLDGNLNEVIQTVNLNGQNKVSLTTPLKRVNRAYNNNSSDLLGNVYIYVDSAITLGVPDDVTKVRGYVSAEGQQTLQGIYTVPIEKTGYLTSKRLSLTGRKDGFADYEVYVRFLGNVFRVQETRELSSSGTSAPEDNFEDQPIFIPGGTDIVPHVTVSANDIGFSITYNLRLEDI
jgi:hypothetical protein